MAEQHREKVFTLDTNMVLALSICPTCKKRPGQQCDEYLQYVLIHGGRLNRVWNMAGLGTPFKKDRMYMENATNPPTYWIEIQPGCYIDREKKLYVDARLRKHAKPRRRRKGR